MDPRRQASRSWLLRVLLLCAALSSAFVSLPTRAATDVVYFSATGHYLRGAFRDFWDKNGGLANFGYPLTEEYIDPQTGRVYQYFERARFERAQPASTTVELGHLGRQLVGDRTFPTSAPVSNTKQRRYFPETKHLVQYGFKDVWESRGGMRIFGLPLSDEVSEALGDGQMHTVQYFERARFEFWEDRPAGQRVLLSLLGRQFAPASLTAPLAPGAPPPPLGVATPTPPPTATPLLTPTPRPSPTPPPLVRPQIPASKNASVSPQAGQPGQRFAFVASGFQPGEEIVFWANLPNGTVQAIDERAVADGLGNVPTGKIALQTVASAPTGIWSIVARGGTTQRVAIGYFLLVGSAISRGPDPQPGVPPNVDARVDPPAGPAGTIFVFGAHGFRRGEQVRIVITASDGRQTGADFPVRADASGSINYAGVYYVTVPGYPLGLYKFDAVGQESGKTSTAYFVLTP